MTISPGDPGPTDPESGGREVPPYDDRRKSADVDEEQDVRKDGANVGGATGPVENEERKSADPTDTERGAVASPADEQPAEDPRGGDEEQASVGPSHYAGTGRGEDKSRDDHDQGEGEKPR
jgi:hypothetical protein